MLPASPLPSTSQVQGLGQQVADREGVVRGVQGVQPARVIRLAPVAPLRTAQNLQLSLAWLWRALALGLTPSKQHLSSPLPLQMVRDATSIRVCFDFNYLIVWHSCACMGTGVKRMQASATSLVKHVHVDFHQ